MSEETFRIVITIAVGLACIAFLVQAGVVIALYGVARKLQNKVSPLIEKAQPVVVKVGPLVDQAKHVMEKAGPVVEKAGGLAETVKKTIEENRPKVAATLA